MPDWRERLAAEIERQNTDMKTVSLKAGLGETYVRDAIKRAKRTNVENLQKVADVLGVNLEWLMRGAGHSAVAESQPRGTPYATIRIVGDVAAGVWVQVEMTQEDLERLPKSVFPPDPRFPISAQYDLRVRGNSINRFAREGELLRCIDLASGNISPRERDMVIIRRTRHDGSMVETSCKELRTVDGQAQYWPVSDDPRYQTPISVEGLNGETDEIRLIAIVLFAYKPSPAR